MRETELFGLSDHPKRLLGHGDPLEALGRIIDFEAFRPTLVASLAYADGSKGCRGHATIVHLLNGADSPVVDTHAALVAQEHDASPDAKARSPRSALTAASLPSSSASRICPSAALLERATLWAGLPGSLSVPDLDLWAIDQLRTASPYCVPPLFSVHGASRTPRA